MASLPERQLQFSVQLATNPQTNQPNEFSETGASSATITGKRASVRIQNSGAPSSSAAQVMIWGLSSSMMNQLSTLGMRLNLVPRNTLTIQAGDTSTPNLSTVFVGTIVNAYADLNSAPDVPFIMECQAGLADATSNAQPTSYPQATSVATIMASFARQMNLGFENNGVNTVLPPSYFRGTAQQQMRKAAEAANINAEIVNGNVLAIWPKYGSRKTATIPNIGAPPVGQMIGYPSFTQQGIKVDNVFDPRISFGGQVNVQTTEQAVSKANGTWTIYKLDLALDCLLPKGEWRATMYCYNQAASQGPVIPPP